MAVSLHFDSGAEDAAHKAAERGLTLATEALLAHAVARAPIMNGPLRGSGLASHEGLTGAASFNTEYAARQHEELDWEHPRGGEAKYLEKAATAFGDEFVAIVAQAIGQALK